MKKSLHELQDKIIFSKYHLEKYLGKGSFSQVFLTKNIKTESLYATKVENRIKSIGLLEKEAYFLYLLKGFGIPEIISFGRSGKYNVLIQQLLGKTLAELFKITKRKNKIKDLCMTAIQIIERIKYIHSKGIIHRDIKPENFLVGYPDSSTIYIIDFGLSRKYRSSKSGKHVNFFKNKFAVGTIRYLSLNASMGIEPTRRDDLESIAYMLIYLGKGNLPWNHIRGKTLNECLFKSYKIKLNTSVEKLCEGLPKEFIIFTNYVKSLKFNQDPNYDYLKNLFINVLKEMQEENDLNFSWIKDIDKIKSKSPIRYRYINNSRKSSPRSRLLQKIKESSFSRLTINKRENSEILTENNLINEDQKSCDRFFNKKLNEQNINTENKILCFSFKSNECTNINEKNELENIETNNKNISNSNYSKNLDNNFADQFNNIIEKSNSIEYNKSRTENKKFPILINSLNKNINNETIKINNNNHKRTYSNNNNEYIPFERRFNKDELLKFNFWTIENTDYMSKNLNNNYNYINKNTITRDKNCFINSRNQLLKNEIKTCILPENQKENYYSIKQGNVYKKKKSNDTFNNIGDKSKNLRLPFETEIFY